MIKFRPRQPLGSEKKSGVFFLFHVFEYVGYRINFPSISQSLISCRVTDAVSISIGHIHASFAFQRRYIPQSVCVLYPEEPLRRVFFKHRCFKHLHLIIIPDNTEFLACTGFVSPDPVHSLVCVVHIVFWMPVFPYITECYAVVFRLFDVRDISPIQAFSDRC